MQNPSTTAPITVWDRDVVSEFFAGDSDILVVDRGPLNNLTEVVNAARVHEYVAPVTRESAGFEVRAGLKELRLESKELTDDLISVVVSFLEQFDQEKASLRIEVTQSQACPKFHCDNLNVRLVLTYLGPSTEFQYAGDPETRTAPLGGLVFLKGHQHPGCRDSVHHRSPEVPAGERRLCIAIDY